MKRKTLADLDRRHDKLFKKFAVLQQKSAAFEHTFGALKTVQRKSKRTK